MQEVITYFKNKAKDYDLVEKQKYWNLSDKLLWEIFKDTVLSKMPENFIFLDAGGGTGRWTQKILDEYPKSKGIIIDISKDMLNEAKNKMQNDKKYSNRIDFIEYNLENIDCIETNKFDLSFNFHNVLGFVENPEKVISELYRVTKKSGYVVSLVPNLYHNVFFNIFVGDIQLAEETMKTKKGKFTKDMPAMNMYTPDSIQKIYQQVGLKTNILSGFPITIYPSMQETQIEGDSMHVANILSSKKNFDKIYEMEKKLLHNTDLASRGNQIYIVGQK